MIWRNMMREGEDESQESRSGTEGCLRRCDVW